MDLEKMRVVIEARNDAFKKKCEEVKKEAHDAAKSADKDLSGIGGESGKKLTTLREKLSALKTMAKALVGAVKLDGGLLAPTKSFEALTASIEKSQNRLEVLKKTLEGLKAKGLDTSNVSEQIAAEEANLANMRSQAQSMFDQSMMNGGVGPAVTANESLSTIEKIKGAIAGIKSVAAGAFMGFKDAHPVLGRILGVLGRIGAVSGKVAVTGVRKLIQGFRAAAAQALRFRQASSGGGGMLGGMFRMIAGLYIFRRALSAFISGLREGMSNLAAYSGQTRANLSMLQNSLAQCKNALATAFAPILNVVAPLLNTLINWLTAAATAVGAFLAAITGQKQTVVAVKVNNAYAGSASNAASAANDAADATEKYQRTLMGFDKINKLDEKNSSGSGGNGGGGGGGAGGGSGFETIEIPAAALDWAEKFKEAWKNADFTEIGSIVAEKLNAALESIPWDKIKATAAKIGKSIATFLNGFIETADWELVGGTFAEALNTVIEFGYAFVENFHWDSFGKAIGDSINGFFNKLDLAKASEGFSDCVKGILDTGIKAVETTDWTKLGDKLADLFINIDYVNIAKKIIEFLAKALIGAIEGLNAFTKKIGEKLEEYFKSGQWLKDIGDAAVLVLDLKLNIVSSAWDLLCTILKTGLNITAEIVGQTFGQFWKWVGEGCMLAITATAKTVGDAWKWIGDNITTNITASVELVQKGWEDVTSWIKKKWGTATDLAVKISAEVSNLANLENLKKVWDGIKSKTKKITAKAKTSGQSALSKIKSTWSGLLNYASNKYLSVKLSVTRGISNTINNVKKAWAKIKGGTKYLKVSLTAIWNGVKDKFLRFIGFKSGGGKYKNGSWHPITAAAGGGSFNEGQMFIARERGPELVGTIGGGTGVMNNDQIVASVSAGVAKAVASVLGDNNEKTPVIVRLEDRAGQIFRVVQEDADNYTKRTGKPAFPV